MGKRLQDLNVSLSNQPLDIFNPDNGAFLRGERAEAALDGVWEGWKTVGKGLIAVGIPLIILAVGILGYFLVWNSSLAVTTEGTIDDFDFRNVFYHYEIDGTRYDKIEPSPRLSVSNWDDGNVPYPVVYLSFLPAESRLSHNVESIDAFTAIFMLVFAIGIPVFGVVAIRSNQRRIALRDDATHVIQGEIYEVFPAARGSVNFMYRGTSPTTGKAIGGALMVGRLSPRFQRIRKGSAVAILYKDDKLHTVL